MIRITDRSTPVLLGLLLLGSSDCNDDTPGGTTTTNPASSSSTTSANSSSEASTGLSSSDGEGNTFGAVDECDTSDQCPPSLHCVAPFDQTLGPEGKGLTMCTTECVPPMDETRWCADHAACCDPAAQCTERGYCVVESESTGDDGSTGS